MKTNNFLWALMAIFIFFIISNTFSKDSVYISCSFTTYEGVRTVANSGNNYVAVYVLGEDTTRILRTLLVIGKTWEMKYYRGTFGGLRIPPSENAPDAITGATRNTHDDISVVWDLKDKEGNTVPDGTYRIYIELSEADWDGALVYGSITIDGTPEKVTEVTEVDKPGHIHNVIIDYTGRTTTRVKEQNNSKFKKAIPYPNPSGNLIHIPVQPANKNSVVKIFDARGRFIDAIMAGQDAWNGRNYNNKPVPEGLYMYKVNIGGKINTGKIFIKL